MSNDGNGARDIFVRDGVSGRTQLVSVNAAGNAGNRSSANSVLSSDGRFVAFESEASDLVANDSNQSTDWEATYFGNLSRDGWGDFDGDGSTDRAEFNGGTNPTNDASVLLSIKVFAACANF